MARANHNGEAHLGMATLNRRWTSVETKHRTKETDTKVLGSSVFAKMIGFPNRSFLAPTKQTELSIKTDWQALTTGPKSLVIRTALEIEPLNPLVRLNHLLNPI